MILFSNLLYFCIRMSTLQFFKIMHDHVWQKTRYPFWQNFLGNRLASGPYSPNLSPMNFFLWNYLKSIVNKDAPQSIAEFKKKIEDAIKEIYLLKRASRVW